MAAPPQKHRLSLPRRRKELLVVIHGIDRDTIAGLVRAGLATARHEAGGACSKTTRVKRYRGRLALEGWPAPLIHPVP